MSVGIFTTAQLTQDLSRKSFAGAITRLMPNGSAPLFGLSSMLAEETAVQIEHGFFTKTMIFPWFKINGAQSGTTAGVTETWTVSAVSPAPGTQSIIPGMILQSAATSENVLVVAVNSNTSVSVIRGFGDTTKVAAVADTTSFFQVGNAYEEASIRPNSLVINPVRITNYTQIFRNTWAISDTIRATQMIAGDTNVAESRQDCAAFHAADIEKALFFGQKTTSTRNGQPIHTMDGLVALTSDTTYYPPAFPTANVSVAGATTNFTQLESFLDPVFNQTTDPKTGNERVLFCGGQAKRVINNIGRLNSTYMLVDGQTNWGLQFATFKTSRGTFRLIEHPLFNSNATWATWAVAVDLATFRIAYLGDRKTQNREFNADMKDVDPVDNGIDAVGGTLTTECTCVVKNPPANAIIKNLTAAAVG